MIKSVFDPDMAAPFPDDDGKLTFGIDPGFVKPVVFDLSVN
jgi:hypothetical protein